MPKIPAAPTVPHLAELVAALNSRLEQDHALSEARRPLFRLHLAGACYAGDLAELQLYVDDKPWPRPCTPRMPPQALLVLLAGMTVALDVAHGHGPSAAVFDRLCESLEPPPAPAADTLAAFGYPAGAAGLSLVAEEMYALRVALHRADPERWDELVDRTDHPAANERAAAAALAALIDAGRGERRSGADVFLTGLGYPEAPEGERRMLAALRELRAALAEQRETTLGRTVWRAQWSEQEIPRLEDLDGEPS